MARIIITNGDHAATALSAHFPDAEILIWRDVLIEGPVPGGISDEALADVRARYIEQAFGMNGVREDFTRRDLAFERITPADQVELWFETDLHDQLQLIQILARFHAQAARPALLLTLDAPPLLKHIEEMAKKLAPVQDAQLEEASVLWTAFRADDPRKVIALSNESGALPEARAAFLRMLEEYPGARDGLGRIERKALLAVRDGAVAPALAFRHYQQTEALPFLGDLGFFSRLDALAFCKHPLLHGIPEGGIARASREGKTLEYSHAEIGLTETGQAVLEERADFVKLNGVDRWIGGVHLNGPDVLRR